ncbi:MAG: mechanosensitive ion channel family protein [Corallincola sp.]|nr:mechanosensitive ion channel family protein [Corallincola sp.]
MRCWLLLLWLLTPLVMAEAELHRDDQPATAQMWNRELVTLLATVNGLTPAQRVARLELRLAELPHDAHDIRVEDAELGAIKGAWVMVDGTIVFGLTHQDADLAAGQTFAQLKQQTAENLKAYLDARHQQLQPQVMARSLLYVLAGTLLFGSLMWALGRVRQRLTGRLLRPIERLHWQVGNVDLVPYVNQLLLSLVRLLYGLLVALLCYLWLTGVLGAIPYTAPFASQLVAFIATTAGQFAEALVAYLPDLLTLVLIYFATRLVVRIVQAFFYQAETQNTDEGWLNAQSARATRRLVSFLIWAFALLVAFPYIPGSESEAFKGISVFVGLMISLGSAGVVGQVLGGLMVSYSGAFREGDLVRIGEHEGLVQSIGVLSTKLRNRLREEITIPNSVLISATTVNFSRLGALASTTVTIGYDAPWRQVEAMLLNAAAATPGIEASPSPLVVQRALSDFYVEYQLLFLPADQRQRPALHRNIQDEFNRNGVQIMSPHFEVQPTQTVMVPPEQWFAAPATRPDEPAGR